MSRRAQETTIAMARASLGAVVIASLGLLSCERDEEEPEISREEAERLIAEMKQRGIVPEPSASALAPSPQVEVPEPRPRASTRASASAQAGDRRSKTSAPASSGGVHAASESRPPAADTIAIPAPSPSDGPWIVDEPVPIAPAGPVTATPRGVVMYNRAGNVIVARLGGLSRRDEPMKTPVAKTSKSAAPFPLGRGPAVVGDHAYWVTHGRVVRRKLGGGPLEVIAEDAQNGARVAGPLPMRNTELADILPTVAYIVRAKKDDGPLGAKLWVEGGETRELTPQGSSTHSVTLAHTAKGLLALSVQARMSMTPVHARPVEFSKNEPVLGDDIVVWVGGGVQPMTEMAILPGDQGQLWGFIPHEESITRFGLARLDITSQPDMKTATSWIFYPNGLDPAPVDGGYLCGRPVVAYVEPQDADPDAAQRLVLRQVGGAALAQVVSKGKAFFDLSFSEVPRGGLVTYVADWVTWAATVRCKSKPN